MNIETFHLPLCRLVHPDPDQVDLWLCDLADLPLAAGPAGESRRDRVQQQRVRQQFLLRLVLGAYLGRPGKAVRVRRGTAGKPYLDSGEPLAFNLSHSGGWLALAVGGAHALGVDVECVRTLTRPLELARRYFCDSEVLRLESLHEPERSAAFLRLWTAKEAVIKAAGATVAGNLRSVELDPGSEPILARLPADWPAPESWNLACPALPDGLVGHLAVIGPLAAIRVRQLLPPS